MIDLAIVGKGPAGWSCAMTARMRGLEVVVIAPQNDNALLKSAELYCAAAEKFPLPVQKFYDWENALRNTLLDFRKKYSPDAADYKRNNPDFYSEIAPVLAQAGNTADLLEAEKMIDKLRWNALDNFGAGHYSDMTALVFYRIRLQILAKYLTRTAEAGNQALENILSGLIDSSNTN